MHADLKKFARTRWKCELAICRSVRMRGLPSERSGVEEPAVALSLRGPKALNFQVADNLLSTLSASDLP